MKKKTEFKTFSKKQLTALCWWCDNSPYKKYDALICDGAIRSGKTLCMSISFVTWAMKSYSDTSFAICGKTIASLRRNLITPIMPILEQLGFECKEKLSRNLLEITFAGKKNLFYFFGGKDESSASLIQGMTLGGVLFDEVALMPRSFVEQALARCSVDGSRFWFNCNPENPLHWFHEEWISKTHEKNCLYLHFTMEDNPSLTDEIIRRYKSLYSGAFYERFIEGKWVAADGLVYPMFSYESSVCELPKVFSSYYVSCDYGTVNPSSFGLWGENDGVWYRINEYYHDSRKLGVQRTDEEHYAALEELCGDRKIEAVIVDPSAASFIECIRRHKRYKVIPAKNDVLDGIRLTSDALKSRNIRFSPACVNSIKEFSLYRWDNKAVRDAPRKEHDHAMDDIRYFVTTVLTAPDSSFFAMVMERR